MTALRPTTAGGSLVGALLDLDVGPVAHGGHCVARSEGRVVFVRHALPGERVRAVVTEGEPAARFLRADAVEVLRAAPERVDPPCPYAGPGRCGGCDWQHADLPAQRRLKAAVVEEQLRRLAKIDLAVTVQQLPGHPDGLGWRTRVRFAVDDRGNAGLRRHRSRDIQPLDRCLIAHPAVEAVGVERRPWPGAEAVEVDASPTTGERAVVVTPRRGAPLDALNLPDLDGDVALLVRGRRGVRPLRGSAAVPGQAALHEQAAGRRWRVSAGGFWQVHPAAADTLVDAVLGALRPVRGESALDLYCGVGLFAAALAERLGPTGEVTAVEEDVAAVGDARLNLAGLATVRVEQGRVERMLPRFGRRTDLVVLDPPRTGAGRTVVERIAGLGPRAIAYVACDPAALARDLSYFADRSYRLVSLRAFDLFPMTHHVECVALLSGRDPE